MLGAMLQIVVVSVGGEQRARYKQQSERGQTNTTVLHE
jgi:hypothetical protein